jgi:hypothetical protein
LFRYSNRNKFGICSKCYLDFTDDWSRPRRVKIIVKAIKKAELKGIQFQKQKIIEEIKFRIKDLKKRKPRLLAETSKYAMQMSIEELQELLKEVKGK